MAPCPLNLKECKISFSQVKLASKVEFNFGWYTWKLHYQNCSIEESTGLLRVPWNPKGFLGSPEDLWRHLGISGDSWGHS